MAQRVAPFAATAGVPTVGAALSGATTGVKLSYVVPAGKNAMVRWMSASNFTGAPAVALQVVVGGTTVTLNTGAAQESISPNFALNAGDTAQLNVTTLVAASTFDGAISVEEWSL